MPGCCSSVGLDKAVCRWQEYSGHIEREGRGRKDGRTETERRGRRTEADSSTEDSTLSGSDSWVEPGMLPQPPAEGVSMRASGT